MNIYSPTAAQIEDSKVSLGFLEIMYFVDYQIAKKCHDFHHCCHNEPRALGNQKTLSVSS